jgi:hypothetical protein
MRLACYDDVLAQKSRSGVLGVGLYMVDSLVTGLRSASCDQMP